MDKNQELALGLLFVILAIKWVIPDSSTNTSKIQRIISAAWSNGGTTPNSNSSDTSNIAGAIGGPLVGAAGSQINKSANNIANNLPGLLH